METGLETMPNLALTLQANGVGSYIIQLLNRAVAVIDKVDGKGWELTVRPGSTQIINRGLFRTPEDALYVVNSEYQSS